MEAAGSSEALEQIIQIQDVTFQKNSRFIWQ